MPACRTPELCPVWWKPATGSRSRTETPRPGWRASSSRATARPMMPAPTTTTSGWARGVAEGGLRTSVPGARGRRRPEVVDPALELVAVHGDVPADLEGARLADVAARAGARGEQHGQHWDPRVEDGGRVQPQRLAQEPLAARAVGVEQLVARHAHEDPRPAALAHPLRDEGGVGGVDRRVSRVEELQPQLPVAPGLLERRGHA